jgi:vacuolar-type H+-ATPase subunit D/Vma8
MSDLTEVLLADKITSLLAEVQRLVAEIDRLREERDRQYDENVNRIAAEGAAIAENARLREALTEARTVIDDQIHAGVLLRATSLQVLDQIDAALAKEAGR